MDFPFPDSHRPAVVVIAALIVVLKAWHGWRIGVVRQAVALVALLVAVGVALVASGPMVVEGQGRNGMVFGLLAYLASTLLAVVIFKKTEQQSVGLIRFGYGLLGAVLGAIHGAIFAALLGVAFLAANGRTEIVEHLRHGRWQQALDGKSNPPAKEPARSRRR